MRYVVGRGVSGRATLMHATTVVDGELRTACGREIKYWSRAYLDYPISQILCLACIRRSKA